MLLFSWYNFSIIVYNKDLNSINQQKYILVSIDWDLQYLTSSQKLYSSGWYRIALDFLVAALKVEATIRSAKLSWSSFLWAMVSINNKNK